MVECTFDTIKIVGQQDYVNRVVESLQRAQRSAYGYQIIRTYIKRIEEGGPPSGMKAYVNPPTFIMSRLVAFAHTNYEEYSIIWCASCIAHDSYHSKLYHDFAKKNNIDPYDPYRGWQKIPWHIWTGTDAELQCIEHQKNVLLNIDGPSDIINRLLEYLGSLDGKHHAGSITWDTSIHIPGLAENPPIPNCLFDVTLPDF